MLFSHPETDYANSPPILGAKIVELLKKRHGFVLIETLLDDFMSKHRHATTEFFFDILAFLYTVNIIEAKGYKIRLVHDYS